LHVDKGVKATAESGRAKSSYYKERIPGTYREERTKRNRERERERERELPSIELSSFSSNHLSRQL
jgi:hypothetical protein